MAKRRQRSRQKGGRRAATGPASPATGAAVAPRRGGFARVFVRAWPVVLVLACVALWFATKSGQLVAAVACVGGLVWLPAALGSLGSEVRPRDNARAGAIDFGKRN